MDDYALKIAAGVITAGIVLWVKSISSSNKDLIKKYDELKDKQTQAREFFITQILEMKLVIFMHLIKE